MTEYLLILPIFLPLLTAIACLFAYKSSRVQAVLCLVGNVALLAASVALFWEVNTNGILAVQVGGWEAPFGITLVADLLGAIMVLLGGVMGLAVAVYSLADIDHDRQKFGFFPLYNILLMGVCSAFLTGDLFNLYVCFEVMLIASFVLLALGGQLAQIEGALKYFVLNLISSNFFLAGVGIVYGKVGTLNMADLALKLMQQPGLGAPDDQAMAINISAMLFLVAFGIKAAIFPFFFWLPASYHTPPVAVSAIFAALLTKVGVYALIRSFTLFLNYDPHFIQVLLLVIAALTMIVGVLGAAAQFEIRRILSFHIISQIGYMVLGLAIFTPLALAGAILYIVHNILAKTNLFLVGGAVQKVRGSGELNHIGGFYKSYPALSLLFFIPAMALAGVPPLSGFWGKLILVQASWEAGLWSLVAVALGVGLMTLFSMTKIWGEVFWKPQPESGVPGHVAGKTNPPVPGLMYVPIVFLTGLIILYGVFAEPLLDIALRSAEQLLEPDAYIHAVMNSPGTELDRGGAVK
ncbi:MAG: Na+/H+ antiporter subunit D [Verrucomicrobiota bacterium]